MAYAFIGTVVHVDEQGFPVCPERFRIHSITVVLARDETTGRAHHPHRLIVAAVPVLQFMPMQGRTEGEARNLRMFATAASHVSGSPGPLAKKRPSNSNVLKS